MTEQQANEIKAEILRMFQESGITTYALAQGSGVGYDTVRRYLVLQSHDTGTLNASKMHQYLSTLVETQQAT
tara:strand:+ start:1226 stop:1441 length:216 start_codon:yes stop_codon:yes gene_type:complete